MSRYDAVVIGSGPAGLEAAVNLKIRGKEFVLFGSRRLSAKIEAAPKIDNYLGLPAVTGAELADRFREHLTHMDIVLRDEMVSTVYPMGSYFSVATNRDTLEASAVILATGAFTSKLFMGEETYLGRGVGYCATCDAPLYKGKTVAVVGYGDEAVMEANFINTLAARTYYIPAKPAQESLDAGIEIVDGPVLEIKGDLRVRSLKLKDRELAVDGVFLLRESVAPASLVPGLALEGGFIRVDQNMQTNYPGCFAAGDCTGKPHQYMRAAGQGQTAALNAAAYLDKLKRRGS